MPPLEVSRTLGAQGSADAGDYSVVGAQAFAGWPRGFDEGLPARLADCFCLGVRCWSVPTEPWTGAKRAPSAPPVFIVTCAAVVAAPPAAVAVVEN